MDCKITLLNIRVKATTWAKIQNSAGCCCCNKRPTARFLVCKERQEAYLAQGVQDPKCSASDWCLKESGPSAGIWKET